MFIENTVNNVFGRGTMKPALGRQSDRVLHAG
jgi:hypothetical protein